MHQDQKIQIQGPTTSQLSLHRLAIWFLTISSSTFVNFTICRGTKLNKKVQHIANLPQIRDKRHPHQQGTFIKNKKAPGLTSYVILKLKIHLNWIWFQIKTHSWFWNLTNILLGESPKSSFISNVLIYLYYFYK